MCKRKKTGTRERNCTFFMGNGFHIRQVNNFVVNQEVMSTCKNKFLLFIKIR